MSAQPKYQVTYVKLLKKKKKFVELLCSNFLKRLSFPEFICTTSQVAMFVEFKIENWD